MTQSTSRTARRGPARIAAGIACVVCAALLAYAGTGRAPGAVLTDTAHARPVPRSLVASSTVEDVLDFAESSSSRVRTLQVRGHTESGGRRMEFRTFVRRPDASRSEEGGLLRVRSGAARLLVDRGSGASTRTLVPDARTASTGIEARMAAHRANDPMLSRPGEIVVDSPVNDLVSPGHKVRSELRHTATSVIRKGTSTVAGRQAIVLEARFPTDLAKEDHWDVYVDSETGILLGLVIEPLPGGDRYEAFLDEVVANAALSDELFDCGVQGVAGR